MFSLPRPAHLKNRLPKSLRFNLANFCHYFQSKRRRTVFVCVAILLVLIVLLLPSLAIPVYLTLFKKKPDWLPDRQKVKWQLRRIERMHQPYKAQLESTAIRTSYLGVRSGNAQLVLADPCEYRKSLQSDSTRRRDVSFYHSSESHPRNFFTVYQRKANALWANGAHTQSTAVCNWMSEAQSTAAPVEYLSAHTQLSSPTSMDAWVATNMAKGFTIVLNTFRRDKCLLSQLRFLGRCGMPKPRARHRHGYSDTNSTAGNWSPHLKEIRIIWPDPERQVPADIVRFVKEYNTGVGNGVEIVVSRFGDTKLSNRFCPGCQFQTDALYTIDDDVYVSCDVFNGLFEHWAHYPAHIIGDHLKYWAPHAVAKASPGDVEVDEAVHLVRDVERVKVFGYRHRVPYEYQSLKVSVTEAVYNVLWVTKGSMMHKKYYEAYWDGKYEAIRGLVDEYITGEDMLMAVVYNDMNSGLRPFLWWTIPQSAVDRDTVLNDMDEVYGMRRRRRGKSDSATEESSSVGIGSRVVGDEEGLDGRKEKERWLMSNINCHSTANSLEKRSGKFRKEIWNSIYDTLGTDFATVFEDIAVPDDCVRFDTRVLQVRFCGGGLNGDGAAVGYDQLLYFLSSGPSQ